jgi:hypothetical protein
VQLEQTFRCKRRCSSLRQRLTGGCKKRHKPLRKNGLCEILR